MEDNNNLFSMVEEHWISALNEDPYRVPQFGGEAGFYDIFTGWPDSNYDFIEQLCRHAIAVESELLTHGYAGFGHVTNSSVNEVHDFHAMHDEILYFIRNKAWSDELQDDLDSYNMSFIDMCARIAHMAAKRVGKALSIIA
jgi:hypothetical protein